MIDTSTDPIRDALNELWAYMEEYGAPEVTRRIHEEAVRTMTEKEYAPILVARQEGPFKNVFQWGYLFYKDDSDEAYWQTIGMGKLDGSECPEQIVGRLRHRIPGPRRYHVLDEALPRNDNSEVGGSMVPMTVVRNLTEVGNDG